MPIFGQAGTVRSGFAFTLEHWNLYDTAEAWRDMTTGTKEEKTRKEEKRWVARCTVPGLKGTRAARRPYGSVMA